MTNTVHHPYKKLYRSDDRILGGVLAGIAEYLVVDPTLIRLAFAFVALITGIVPAALVYFTAWAIIPAKEHRRASKHDDDTI